MKLSVQVVLHTDDGTETVVHEVFHLDRGPLTSGGSSPFLPTTLSPGSCASTLGGRELLSPVLFVAKPLQTLGEQLVEEFVLGQLRLSASSHEQHRVTKLVGERFVHLERPPSRVLPLHGGSALGA